MPGSARSGPRRIFTVALIAVGAVAWLLGLGGVVAASQGRTVAEAAQPGDRPTEVVKL